MLALLCYDETNGALVASMVEGKHFDAVYRDVAEQALDFRERFHEAPGTHTLDIFDSCKDKDPDREDLFDRLFESVKEISGTINPSYIVDRTRHFIRYQNLKKALASAVRELNKDDEAGLSAAESLLTEALSDQTSNVHDPGTFFIDDIPRSLRFLDQPDEALPTGIPALDARGLGPIRKRVNLLIAPPKRGKSWWLINLATRANQAHKAVLYVTLELDEAEVCRRLVQSFFSIAKRPAAELVYRRFIETEDRKDMGTRWDVKKLQDLPHMLESKIRAKLVRKLETFQGGERLLVKEYPMSTLTLKHLESYLDTLENRDRFVPDLLIVDYADIMKLPRGKDRWEGLVEVYQGLKRIAQERHLALATASQTTNSGSKSKRVDSGDVAGSWDKIATVDTAITYSQTDEERTDRLARLFVAAARTDEDRFEMMISQAYDIGQFALSSTRLGEHFYKSASDEDR